ncbi:MAG: DUF4382 domain-containing protein [Telluria sp.]
MKQHLTRFGLLAGSALCAAVLVACGGGKGSSDTTTGPTPAATTGSLSVALTDAPACGFDAVNVTVTKVRVNQSATAADTDSTWIDLALSPARKFNLLALSNGVTDTLGQTSLAAGHYGQIRLVLDTSANANTVVPTGTTQEIAMDTPSAASSGLKLNGGFDITSGSLTSLVIDFDACKSVLRKGNGAYSLKPVLTLVPSAQNGISGVIAASALTHHVMVMAEQNGQVVASATPDLQTGVFLVSHLTAGNYDLVATSDNSAASVIGAVPVTASATTAVSTAAAPLSLAPSNTASISGTVTMTPASTEAAYVSAKQTLSGGQAVTIKYQGADLANGAYTLANLPQSAPQYAPYIKTLPLSFAPGTTPGVYAVEASSTGYTTKSAGNVDITGGSKSGVDITLTP